jgi:hypothetical protein
MNTKILRLVIIGLLITVSSFSQTTVKNSAQKVSKSTVAEELPFIADFEQSDNHDGPFQKWTTENLEGWHYWHIVPGQYMRFENTDLAQNDWLITNPINCSGIENLKVNFNHFYSSNKVPPRLYYTNQYNGDASQSVWTELNYSLGDNEYQWYSSEDFIIENPGDVIYFSFHYQAEPNAGTYFLLDNFSVESYTPPPVLELVGSSENFEYYSNSGLYSLELANTLEKKFDNLDKTIYSQTKNINLLDRSQKIKVFLYDSNETFNFAPSDVRDWDVGYYLTSNMELHIKAPSTTRQLKYFPTIENAAISILVRYIIDKKRGGLPLEDGRSFGFGLYESGYSPDINLLTTYLNTNNNILPSNYSSFSTWDQLEDEINVELAYTYIFASIFRYGYFNAIGGGISYGYEPNSESIWYQIIRLYFLANLEDGGMRKFVDEDDFVIYGNTQEEAQLALEGLRWYANYFEEEFGVRINHSFLVSVYGSAETYTYTRNGNIDVVVRGGEAFSHHYLRYTGDSNNLTSEMDRLLAKFKFGMSHEFMHNHVGYMMETVVSGWLNEGAAMYEPRTYLQGYQNAICTNVSVTNFKDYHNFFWNDNMYLPDLDKIFDRDVFFGYSMAPTAYAFLKSKISKEVMSEFIKRSDDFSIIGYNSIEDFQRHFYETLYHLYLPTFLFNPNWDLERTYAPGTNYVFNWDGHYINNLTIDYSVDGAKSWNVVSEVDFSSNSFSWNIPNVENCILRFSDSDIPEINFTFQLLGEKPTFDKTLYFDFENEAHNSILNYNNGEIKGDVSFESRGDKNGNYAKFGGMWNAITVQHYENISLNEEWTIQGDFLIDNTTGIMNQKPVLLKKMSSDRWRKNYSISFNNSDQRNLTFEYDLENSNTITLNVEAEILDGNWYSFYFARSVENNIVEARVYDQQGNMIGNTIKELNGEGNVSTGSGQLYLGTGDFYFNEKCLQGGLDNILISDTYHNELMSNSSNIEPVVSDIPNQSVNEGGSFTTIELDNFVTDIDNDDTEITWSYYGNEELLVEIDNNRIATITIPNEDWNGSETITFIATDLDGATNSNDVIFSVVHSSFELPSNNFTIETTSETCPSKNNGELTITANETHSYTATINNVNHNFTNNSLTVANLAPGTYTVCISVTGENFEQCYTIVIAEGKTVSGKASVNSNKASISIEQGTAPYNVYVNGISVLNTLASSFTIDVKHGDLLEVKTAKYCEGVFLKAIDLFENITVYPNPSKGIFEITLPISEKEVVIELYTMGSQLISKGTYQVVNGKVQINLEKRPTGVYVVKIYLDTPVNLTIIKE